MSEVIGQGDHIEDTARGQGPAALEPVRRALPAATQRSTTGHVHPFTHLIPDKSDTTYITEART